MPFPDCFGRNYTLWGFLGSCQRFCRAFVAFDAQAGHICPAGMLGAEDLRIAYAASDLFVSASTCETLGNTVVEVCQQTTGLLWKMLKHSCTLAKLHSYNYRMILGHVNIKLRFSHCLVNLCHPRHANHFGRGMEFWHARGHPTCWWTPGVCQGDWTQIW